jgi:branched-chain amino acid transport system permease protein
MSDADAPADDSGSPLDAARSFIAGNDAAMIVSLMLGLYLLFSVFGVLLGFDLNGVLNTLRRVTFLTAAYAMLVLALNLHWGYTGLFNIGVAGFMAVGVYTFGILTGSPDATATTGAPGLGMIDTVVTAVAGTGLPAGETIGLLLGMGIALVLSMIAAGLVGFVAALPALRLEADYLAIVTVALSEIIRLSINSRTLQEFTIGGTTVGTGGAIGIFFTRPEVLATWLIYEDPRATSPSPNAFGEVLFGVFEGVAEPSVVAGFLYALVLLLGVAAFYWLLRRTGNSPFGRVLKSIREDEVVASSLGKDTNRFKVKAFVVGCALMGLGGILWKGAGGSSSPTNFMPRETFFIFIALIIGGAGSNTGSVLGGAVFAGVLFEGPAFVRSIVEANVNVGSPPPTFVEALTAPDVLGALLAYTVANVSALRLVLLGAILVYLMQNRPEGLLGHRKEEASAVDLNERPDRPDQPGAAATDGGTTDE